MYVNHATSDRSVNTMARQCEILALECHKLACEINTATYEGDFNLDITFMKAQLLDQISTAVSDLAYNLEDKVSKAIKEHNETVEKSSKGPITTILVSELERLNERSAELAEREDEEHAKADNFDIRPRRELSSDGSY